MFHRFIFLTPSFLVLFLFTSCKTHGKRMAELSQCRRSLSVLAVLMDQELSRKGLQPSLSIQEVKSIPQFSEIEKDCPGLMVVQGKTYPQGRVVWDLEQGKNCTMVADLPGPSLTYDNCPGSISPPPQGPSH